MHAYQSLKFGAETTSSWTLDGEDVPYLSFQRASIGSTARMFAALAFNYPVAYRSTYVSVVERAPAEEEAAARLAPAAFSGSPAGTTRCGNPTPRHSRSRRPPPRPRCTCTRRPVTPSPATGTGAVWRWGAPLRRTGPPLRTRPRSCTNAWSRGTGERWTLPRT